MAAIQQDNNMNNGPVSEVSNLRIYKTADILGLAKQEDGSVRVTVQSSTKPVAGILPGSETRDFSKKGGLVTRKIKFRLKGYVTPEFMKTSGWVAVYTDERGEERLAGSKTFPLFGDYEPDNGLWMVTLSGDSEAYDPPARLFIAPN